jgi:hypothetical protein
MWPPGVVTIRVPQDPHFFNLHGLVKCYQSEHIHLENEVKKKEFLERFIRIPLNPGYALLKTPIEPTPISVSWLKVLGNIQQWLLYAMAYAGVLPVKESNPAAETVGVFQMSPILDNVIVNKEIIADQLIHEIDLNPAKIIREYLN